MALKYYKRMNVIHRHSVCFYKQPAMSLTPRYETLAVATEAESRQDPDLPLKTGGKRLTVSPEHTTYICHLPITLKHIDLYNESIGEKNVYTSFEYLGSGRHGLALDASSRIKLWNTQTSECSHSSIRAMNANIHRSHVFIHRA